jgi:hypothetical protein
VEQYSRVAFDLDVAFGFGQEDDRMISIVAHRTPSPCGGQMVRGDFEWNSPARSISWMLGRAQELGDQVTRACVCAWIKSAEFRGIWIVGLQVRFFREEGHKLDWRRIGILFGRRFTTLWYWVEVILRKNPEVAMEHHDESRLVGPNGYLTFAEENIIVDWIIQEQRRKACPTSVQVRKQAVIMRSHRIEDLRSCTKYWWRGFKNRHPELDTK